MDLVGSTVTANLHGSFKAIVENCIRLGTDHIIITNSSGAGMTKGQESPRYLSNKKAVEQLGDETTSKLQMNKAFIRSKLLQSPGPFGWLSMHDALTLGQRVKNSGSGDCDLCAAAAIYVLSQCSQCSSASIEVFGTGGHAFVVMNRDQSGNARDCRTWGASCLIVDVWSHNQGISLTSVMNVSEYADLYEGGLSTNRLL